MNKKSPKEIILSHSLSPKKSFGQNFMQDQNINQKFADAVLKLSQKKLLVIEIGAGTGALTEFLLTVSPKVHAIERDRDLLPILNQRFHQEIITNKLMLHEANGVTFPINSICSNIDKGILVGNLPYHLTSSILLMALENRQLLAGAVFMVQKEVALRILSKPDNKIYGFLSVILQLGFDINLVSHVSKQAFWPVPKVDSSIISLKTNNNYLDKLKNLREFILFVRSIFQKRRKKLSTILGADYLPILNSLKIDPNLRPENLAPKDFLNIFMGN